MKISKKKQVKLQKSRCDIKKCFDPILRALSSEFRRVEKDIWGKEECLDSHGKQVSAEK